MRSSVFLLAAVAAISGPGVARADDPPKRTAELKVLDRYLGQWDVVVAVKGTDEKSVSVESRKWSQQGTFILSDNQDAATKSESHFLMTYDAKNKQYRSCFIGEDSTVPLSGNWDEKT